MSPAKPLIPLVVENISRKFTQGTFLLPAPTVTPTPTLTPTPVLIPTPTPASTPITPNATSWPPPHPSLGNTVHPVADKVSELKAQGMSDDEIVEALKALGMGYDPLTGAAWTGIPLAPPGETSWSTVYADMASAWESLKNILGINELLDRIRDKVVQLIEDLR
ncbi:hypothetical protein ACFLTS_03825 [Chloroflexota bacterium]